MEIREQIQRLSENPIFFMSPNIGIKFSLIKAYPDLISKKQMKNLELVLKGEKYDYIGNKKIDSDFLTVIIIDYLNNQKSDFLKYFNIDLHMEKMDGKDAFYVNAFMAYYYYDNNNYERAEPYIKFALKYVENNEVSDYEKMCIYSLTAYFLKTQSVFINGAENYFVQALELIGEEDALGKISLLNSFAYYYHNIEKRDKAIAHINIALEMVKKHTFGISSFTTYKNAGIIYTTIGDFEKAKWSFAKAFEFTEDLIDNPEENVKLLNTLGYVEFLKGDFSDSFENHDKALMLLINRYSNVTKLLDEAVKTFDNLGNIFKFLGDIDSSLYIQLFGKDMLERVNSVNRVNEFHNLQKIYMEIAMTYLFYKSDYGSAKLYFDLAEAKQDETEHYINKNKKIVLETLIELSGNWNSKSERSFYEAIEELRTKGKDNLYVQIIMMESLIYCYRLRKDKKLLDTASEIAEKYSLSKHYDAIYNNICGRATSGNKVIDLNRYPLNLINLLSKEKKELLMETKKSKHFELIEEFINDISKADKDDKLFKISENSLNKYFFSRGFIVVEKHKKKFSIKYFNETSKEVVKEYGELFISEAKQIKEQQIFNFADNAFIKSCIMEKIDYKEENLTYYFILFNDKKNDWNFNIEELKTFGILMNNLYLKHKNLIQLEKIELNSVTDCMTGFKNAGYYNKTIKGLIKRYNSAKQGFGIAIIDLNKFKIINDTFGHDVGDKTLKYFSKMLKSKIKGDVEFIRYGGDEFILLFDPEIDMEKEFFKIKAYFLKHPLVFNAEEIFVSFSYGIEIYKGQPESDFFRNADRKMYKQKMKKD